MDRSNMLAQFKIHDRVQAAPHTNCWMTGDRYGVVVKIGRSYAHVRMDKSGKVLQFSPENISAVVK